ncbi:MAG TPA: TetR family transcriptional regulator [Turneriella sp.]|nr:TetR family transcriptional regulator [Turneriella sp.]
MKKSQQRLKTHRALMVSAIRLMSDDRSFSSISLREVTREAGVVPATFYRHFNEMEDLAVELVDYCMRPMENLMTSVRARRLNARQLVYETVSSFLRFARRHRRYSLFLTKERLGGRARVRERIRLSMNNMALMLAHDLKGLPEWRGVPNTVVQDVARMIINQMLVELELVLDLQPSEDLGKDKKEIKIIAGARKRIWILLNGGLSFRERRLKKARLRQRTNA